jgi:PKD repeat protein
MNKKFLAITITLFAVFSFLFTGEVQAGSGDNVSGWAWSENIGLISFNCNNPELPAPRCTYNYGVNINSLTGYFSGYAWSENIGWVRFDPTGPYPFCPPSTCPTSPDYSARVNLTASPFKITGWARACAGAADEANCSGGTNPNSGGWDGWILLGPIVKAGTDYGVWIDNSLNPAEFKGWVWGSDVVGLISFNCLNRGVCTGATGEGGPSNYKVITSFIFNQPPSATNLWVDPPNSTDYCGITGYPRVRLKWQFSDPGDSQSAYQIQVAASSGFSPLVLDTGKITGPTGQSQTFVIQPPYSTLFWNTTYYWRLKVWDSQDTPSTDWIVYQNNTPPPESFTTAIHSYPYPDFTLSPQNPAIGEVVTFTDNSKCYSSPGNTEYSCSTGGSISYLWDFGNGQTPTTKGNATTTYTTTGPKTVRLTITDNSLTPAGSCDTTRQVAITLPLPEYQEVPPTTWLKNLFAEIVNLFDGFLKI